MKQKIPRYNPNYVVSMRRGFTLLELMVALGIGLAISFLAFTLTADMQRYSHRHMSELGASQRLRQVLDLIASDVYHAGIGVGYTPTGEFEGFLVGDFQAEGGAQFDVDNRSITTVDGVLLTDDLGVRRADGERRTILYLEEGLGLICDGMNFEANELVAVTARNGSGARTLRVLDHSSADCTRGSCVDGCQSITYSEDETYRSDSSVVGRSFSAGDLYRGFETVVWFVVTDDEGNPSLRRAGQQALASCSDVSASCGAEVAEGIEVVQYTMWQMDSSTEEWVEVSKESAITAEEALRVDIEIVAKGQSDPNIGMQHVVESQLEPSLCIPTHCGDNSHDQTPRLVLRTTIEVRNAGRLRIR